MCNMIHLAPEAQALGKGLTDWLFTQIEADPEKLNPAIVTDALVQVLTGQVAISRLTNCSADQIGKALASYVYSAYLDAHAFMRKKEEAETQPAG